MLPWATRRRPVRASNGIISRSSRKITQLQLGLLVLEREVAVAGGADADLADLALDPHVAQPRRSAQRALDQLRDLADGEDRQARRPASRLRLLSRQQRLERPQRLPHVPTRTAPLIDRGLLAGMAQRMTETAHRIPVRRALCRQGVLAIRCTDSCRSMARMCLGKPFVASGESGCGPRRSGADEPLRGIRLTVSILLVSEWPELPAASAQTRVWYSPGARVDADRVARRSTKSGTWTTRPVSVVAGLRAPPVVSPAKPGSVSTTLRSTVTGSSTPIVSPS